MKPNFTIPASIISRPCIYGWRRNKKYLYIGQSISVIKRLREHNRSKGPFEDDDKIDIFFCCQSELLKFEAQMIKEFDPPLNKCPINERRELYSTFKEAFESKGPVRKSKPRKLNDVEIDWLVRNTGRGED